MYGVEKTAVEWRLENCDKVNKYLNTSPVDWLNFEEEFTFCASPPFNTLSTKKLKEIVLKAKTTFKLQSSREGQLRREDSFNDWMFTRPLGSRRKRDSFAEKTPSMIGCLQGLWH